MLNYALSLPCFYCFFFLFNVTSQLQNKAIQMETKFIEIWILNTKESKSILEVSRMGGGGIYSCMEPEIFKWSRFISGTRSHQKAAIYGPRNHKIIDRFLTQNILYELLS